jgi:hypothetical protein
LVPPSADAVDAGDDADSNVDEDGDDADEADEDGKAALAPGSDVRARIPMTTAMIPACRATERRLNPNISGPP